MRDKERKQPKSPQRSEQLRFDWSGTESGTRAEPAPLEPETRPEVAAVDPEVEGTPQIDEATAEGTAYSPRHPWHYYVEGDHASPVPFDAIPASESSGRALAEDLPKSPAKRLVKVRELFETERSGLAEAAVRYQDVVERGAEALSNYDRTIAYGGNDELARAATLALLYNQIAWRRGRVFWLEKENARGGGGWLKR